MKGAKTAASVETPPSVFSGRSRPFALAEAFKGL
jgi:hypothetical protein